MTYNTIVTIVFGLCLAKLGFDVYAAIAILCVWHSFLYWFWRIAKVLDLSRYTFKVNIDNELRSYTIARKTITKSED